MSRLPLLHLVAIVLFFASCWLLARNLLIAGDILCPNPNGDVLVCGIGDCEASTLLSDASLPICAGKLEGCECVPPAPRIPPPEWPTSDSLNCSNLRHEPGVDIAPLLAEQAAQFSRDYERFGGQGDLWGTYPLAKPEGRQPSKPFVELSWRNRPEVDCVKDKTQIYWNLFNSPGCRLDNRTISVSGTLRTPCGEASYKLVSAGQRDFEHDRSKDLGAMAKADWEGNEGTIYDGFCSEWEPDSYLLKTVDFKGQQLSPRRSLYLEPNVDLQYRPKNVGGQCEIGCEEAMYILKASFDSNQVPEEAETPYMAKSATYDTKCGRFSYRVRDQKEELVLLDGKCLGPRYVGNPGHTPWEVRDKLQRHVSEQVAGQTLHEGEEKVVYASDAPDAELVVVARWEENCKLENGQTQMKLDTPILGSDVTTCEEVLAGILVCENLVGASVQVGCTVWEIR